MDDINILSAPTLSTANIVVRRYDRATQSENSTRSLLVSRHSQNRSDEISLRHVLAGTTTTCLVGTPSTFSTPVDPAVSSCVKARVAIRMIIPCPSGKERHTHTHRSNSSRLLGRRGTVCTCASVTRQASSFWANAHGRSRTSRR